MEKEDSIYIYNRLRMIEAISRNIRESDNNNLNIRNRINKQIKKIKPILRKELSGSGYKI